MEKEKEIHSCVDCGTQNCKYKDRTYPDFCLTTNLKEEDMQWALERYDEGDNRRVMIASAEVEYKGYCQWTRVQEIMEFARKNQCAPHRYSQLYRTDKRGAYLCPYSPGERFRSVLGNL